MIDPGSHLPTIVSSVQSGAVSCVSLVRAARRRIENLDTRIGAFVSTDLDRAEASAAELDHRVRAGEKVGPLAGVLVGVKDTQDVKGLPTTYGSVLYRDAPPATQDCVLVARLRFADAIIVGKTNTSEFELSPDTVNLLHGQTDNPLRAGYSPGGSSGGSAAAVAAGLVPLATASDGGGSIRGPAGHCGLPGFKPTLGVVPHGDLDPPDWPDLSTRGVIAADLESTALAYDVVSGPHPRELRSRSGPRLLPAVVSAPSDKLDVVWSSSLGWARLDNEVATMYAAFVALLREHGIGVTPAEPLADQDPGRAWSVLAATGTWRRLRRDVACGGTVDLTRVTPSVARLLASMRDVSADEYAASRAVGHALSARFDSVIGEADVLLCPATRYLALRHGTPFRSSGFTYAFNLADLPAGTLPIGRSREGLALSIQVVGRRGDDVGVMAAMHALTAVRKRLGDMHSGLG